MEVIGGLPGRNPLHARTTGKIQRDGYVVEKVIVNVVQGALLEYDLPNLAATLGAKLTVENARDAAGKPIAPK